MTETELRAQRDALLTDARALVARAEADGGRDLTPDEQRRWTEIERRLSQVTGALERARRLETEERVARVAAPYEVPPSQRGSGSWGAPPSWLDVRALSAGVDAAGGYFVPLEQASLFVDRLIVSNPLLGQLQRVTMTSDTLTLPGVSADMVAAWVPEGVQLTASDPTYRAVTLRAHKVAGYTIASTELFQDSNPALAQVVRGQLERSVATALELAFFEGTGSNQPTALRSVPGISTITTLGNDGAVPASLDMIADAIGELITNGARAEAIVAYMHPRSWKTISKIKTGVTGSQQALLQVEQGGASAAPVRTVYGVPVYFSGAISTAETRGINSDCSSIYLFDPTQVVFATRELVRLETDKGLRFDYDQVCLRCIARADFGVLNPGAVARIVGVRA